MADRKRPRDTSPASQLFSDIPPSSPPRGRASSLPPSSPPQQFEDIEEEDEIYDDAPEEMEDDGIDDAVDLFGDNLERDYAARPSQDVYDPRVLDDEDYEDMDITERLAVEAKLRRRDEEIARREGRLPAAFMDDGEDEDELPNTRRRRRADIDMEEMDEEEIEEMPLEDLEDMKGKSITEWITMEGPRLAIRREFKKFLLEYVDENGTSVYGDRVRTLGEANLESLDVSYQHLSRAKGILALFLGNSPVEMLKIFDAVAMDVVLVSFPEYERIHQGIHVRITDLPIMTSLRDLRQNQLNCLVRVSGVVTRRSGVFPQLKYVKYDCIKCGSVLGPFYQDAQHEIKVGSCPSCQSKGPFTVNSEQTIYRNYQKMTLQETPGSVPAGRLPRHREVIMLWDLIDCAKPGEEVEVTGVYRNNFDSALNTKNGFPVFSTIIEANYISKKEDMFASTRLSEDEIKKIRNLARDERIGQRIIKSIAPSIFGHEDIKTALALALFSGIPKDIKGKHRLRGDINILLLGDPGTAKSQFLKYVEKTAHRAVFTTGQGASAVGLTASVRKDPLTREWTLEGGALVLADKGACLIDEFDKMNDADRTSIHEAMEQQSISISKAGIVTTLQARCSVIAAANPIRGRYNPAIPFSQNVELTEPILSRFDVLCVVKDTVDPVIDEQLAKFVINSHMRSHPDYYADVDAATLTARVDPDFIPQDLLRKYIMYAKDKIHPKLNNMDQDKIAKLYSELRRESLAGGSIPITVRHIESMIRMSEAHAKMHLREYVRADDIDMAIRVMLESFISAQKYSVMRTLRKAFSKYITYMRDNDELLFYTLSQLLKEQLRWWQHKHRRDMPTELVLQGEEFEMRAKELNIHDVHPFYTSTIFTQNGYSHDAAKNTITKTFEH